MNFAAGSEQADVGIFATYAPVLLIRENLRQNQKKVEVIAAS